MNSPLVSIIVPVYNREKSIGCCLNSILALTVKDFEVIVVDDGSHDASTQICQDIAARDNRVKFVRQKNKGVSAARNNALDMAKGQYITFVDSDDAVHASHLDMLWQERDFGADMMMCDHGTGRLVEGVVQCVSKTLPFERCEADVAAQYLFNDFKPFENPIYPIWNKFFKRDIIESHHISFDETMSLGEDQVFLCEYLQYAGKIVHYNAKTILSMPWTNIVHLGGKLRTPEDYLYNQKKNYAALSSVIEISGGGQTAWYTTDYGIDRPITRILYNYTKWKNRGKLSQKDLASFTETEIVPYLKSIDVTKYHAVTRNVRWVYYLLMNVGVRYAITWCWIYNVYTTLTAFPKRVLRKIKESFSND